jgi:hypothetical protein
MTSSLDPYSPHSPAATAPARRHHLLLHPLIRARLPASAIAARLATTADHVLLTATRSPAPRLPGDPLTARSP